MDDPLQFLGVSMRFPAGSAFFGQLAILFGLGPKRLGADPHFFGKVLRFVAGATVAFPPPTRALITCHRLLLII
jgi:hypothetical protein